VAHAFGEVVQSLSLVGNRLKVTIEDLRNAVVRLDCGFGLQVVCALGKRMGDLEELPAVFVSE